MDNLELKIKDDFVQQLADEMIFLEKSKSISLTPDKNLKEKAYMSAEQEWNEMHSKIEAGVGCLFEELERQGKQDILEKIKVAMGKLSHEINKHIDEIEQNNDNFKFENEFVLQSIYEIAKEQLIIKEYSKAISLFYLLVLLSPNLFDFWLGLGIAHQAKGNEEEAIKAYEVAKEIAQNEHPLPLIYLAECYKALNNPTQAKHLLDRALHLIHQHQQFKDYLAEAKHLLATI